MTPAIIPINPELKYKDWFDFEIREVTPGLWKLINRIDGVDDFTNGHETWFDAYLVGLDYIRSNERYDRLLESTQAHIRVLAEKEGIPYEQARDTISEML